MTCIESTGLIADFDWARSCGVFTTDRTGIFAEMLL